MFIVITYSSELAMDRSGEYKNPNYGATNPRDVNFWTTKHDLRTGDTTIRQYMVDLYDTIEQHGVQQDLCNCEPILDKINYPKLDAAVKSFVKKFNPMGDVMVAVYSTVRHYYCA